MIALILLLLIGAFIQLITIHFNNLPLASDAVIYHALALNMINDLGYTFNLVPYTHYPPLYSLFLALLYSLFSPNFLLVKLFQVLLLFLSNYLLYKILLHFNSQRIALLCLALIIVNPLYYNLPNKLLSENLYLPFFYLWILIIIKLQRSTKHLEMITIFSGFIFGLTLLTKSIALFSIPLFTLSLLSNFKLINENRYKFQTKILKLTKLHLIFIFAVILTLSPWIKRNYELYHKFIPLSTSAGITIYSFYNFKIPGNLTSDNVTENASKIAKDPAEYSSLLIAETVKYIKDNPIKMVKLIFYKIYFFLLPLDWDIAHKDSVGLIPGINFTYLWSLFFIPFFLVAILKKKFQFNFISKLIFIHTLITITVCFIFFPISRFKITIEPFLILYGLLGVGLLSSIFKFKRKYVNSFAFTLFIMVLILHFNWIPIYKFLKS